MIGENKHPHNGFPALCLGKSPGPSAVFLPSIAVTTPAVRGPSWGPPPAASPGSPAAPAPHMQPPHVFHPIPSHCHHTAFPCPSMPPARGEGAAGEVKGPCRPATTGLSLCTPRPVGFYFRSNAVGGFLSAASPFLPQWYNLLVSDRSLSKDLLKPH